tara:strand:- start:446 stop:1141 length:696 start_codon:yes stop_codon:yes gene_type:complete
MKPHHQPTAEPAHNPFAGDAARSYAEGPPRKVPGFAGLHRMTAQLLAERVPPTGRILVLGAGGGLELQALASEHPFWTFDGVDPSADMLRTAQQVAADHLSRITLHEGYIDAAPAGPFDGAVCLLTLHFVPREQRLDTLRAIHARLAPGAPLVVAHVSFAQTEPERSLWISRHLTFGGTDPAATPAAHQAMASRLSILSPEEDAAMLEQAGFSGVTLFYAGLSFRGWVCYC